MTITESSKQINYIDLSSRQQKEWNDFPMFFAFSQEQFSEGLKKFNVTKKDIYSIESGGFIRKSDSERLNKLIDKHHKENEDAMKNDKFLFQAFRYELGNHEFCITYDPEDTLRTLGLELKDIEEEGRIQNIYEKARSDYIKRFKGEI